jgi:hypothetical protein
LSKPSGKRQAPPSPADAAFADAVSVATDGPADTSNQDRAPGHADEYLGEQRRSTGGHVFRRPPSSKPKPDLEEDSIEDSLAKIGAPTTAAKQKGLKMVEITGSKHLPVKDVEATLVELEDPNPGSTMKQDILESPQLIVCFNSFAKMTTRERVSGELPDD